MNINEAIEFAKAKHAGQKRKNGEDYISHPLTVALMLSEQGCSEDVIVAGLFHDLLEDTDTKEDEILSISNEHVLRLVRLLTLRPGDDKQDYINNILADSEATAIKNADRIHNLIDAKKADRKFAEGYLKNTKKYFVGRFSKELDRCYEDLCATLDATEYIYAIDASFAPEMTTLYRSTSTETWEYNRDTYSWDKTSPYFWADLDDCAQEISEAEAEKLIDSWKKK